MRPLAIELFAGLHGWGAGLAAAGFRCVGFDIVDMPRLLNHPVPEHCSLVLQDVRTLHGSQFRDAHLIVASPPCQRYSFMAMPFSRGKRLAAEIRADESGEKLRDLNALFNACFRIQREASEAAGRYIPMVVENVRGAQPWVGRANWSYGSYYLWGDVPALMPSTLAIKGTNPVPNRGWTQGCAITLGLESYNGQKVPGMNFHDFEKTGKPGRSFQSAAVAEHTKIHTAGNGINYGGNFGWDGSAMRTGNSKSSARRAASALIAKIPFALAEHIGRVYYPGETP